MMETGEDRDSNERGSNWRPGRGQVPGAGGGLHAQAAMGAAMVIGRVLAENAPGMLLVSDDVWSTQSLRRVPMARSAKGWAAAARSVG